MKALIYKSTGSWYVVKTENGQTYNARMKGIFRIDDITSTNPIAVGDHVKLEIQADAEGAAMITEISDRRNYVTRQAPSNRTQQHIVAANVDQSLLFATLKDPRTSQGFIDRFLVTCEAYHVPAIIVFNKIDLYRKKELDKLEHLAGVYEDIGYQVSAISIKEKTGIDDLKLLLAGKTTLMSGHSGVGKSSFLNAVFPSFQLKTQDVSGWSGKGMHTTTFAEMYDLPEGGRIIDTPGMREFGIIDISKQELSHYFPEMRELLPGCQFNNCLHLNEPGCAIKKGLSEGLVDEERYFSYLNILDSFDQKY